MSHVERSNYDRELSLTKHPDLKKSYVTIKTTQCALLILAAIATVVGTIGLTCPGAGLNVISDHALLAIAVVPITCAFSAVAITCVRMSLKKRKMLEETTHTADPVQSNSIVTPTQQQQDQTFFKETFSSELFAQEKERDRWAFDFSTLSNSRFFLDEDNSAIIAKSMGTVYCAMWTEPQKKNEYISVLERLGFFQTGNVHAVKEAHVEYTTTQERLQYKRDVAFLEEIANNHGTNLNIPLNAEQTKLLEPTGYLSISNEQMNVIVIKLEATGPKLYIQNVDEKAFQAYLKVCKRVAAQDAKNVNVLYNKVMKPLEVHNALKIQPGQFFVDKERCMIIEHCESNALCSNTLSPNDLTWWVATLKRLGRIQCDATFS